MAGEELLNEWMKYSRRHQSKEPNLTKPRNKIKDPQCIWFVPSLIPQNPPKARNEPQIDYTIIIFSQLLYASPYRSCVILSKLPGPFEAAEQS